MRNTSVARSGIAAIMALAAAGAAQADNIPSYVPVADKSAPTYDQALADQAIITQLDQYSTNPYEKGLSAQIPKMCSSARIKQFAYKPDLEFSAYLTGKPLEDYQSGKAEPEWLGIDCDLRQVWHGTRAVIDAKVAQMEADAAERGQDHPRFFENPVMHGGGVVIIGPDGGVQIRQDDYPVIEGSPNPGLSGP